MINLVNACDCTKHPAFAIDDSFEAILMNFEEEFSFSSPIDFSTDVNAYEIAKGAVQVTIGDNIHDGLGRVIIRAVPSPELYLDVTVAGIGMSEKLRAFFNETAVGPLLFNGSEVPGFSTGVGGTFDGDEVRFRWIPSKQPVIARGSESTPVTSIVFSLFAFPNFTSRNAFAEERKNCHQRINMIAIEANHLQCRIRSLFETEDNCKKIKDDGKTRSTHVGEIRFGAAKSITAVKALEYVTLLFDAFSFAAGKRLYAVCPTGHDEYGEKVLETWTTPASSTKWTYSWFDPHHTEHLEQFVPQFLSQSEDEVWKRPLHEAIYWYLRANQSGSGIDAGIILTQTALELLSFTYAVQSKGMLSTAAFKDLRASDKIRLLLASCEIPRQIPAECACIQNAINGKKNQLNWTDLPHALTEIRNSLVHPERKNREIFGQLYTEAWKAGLWCLELSILQLCGYKGTYANRLKQRRVGAVENVPWI